MVDFLKTNPYVTREEYMWEWSVPQINLASYDFTHIRYLTEKERKLRKNKAKLTRSYDNPRDFVNDLGIPVFKK